MNIHEAKSGVKAIYLQAASLAGLEVGPYSPERFVGLLDNAYSKVEESRRPEAVANLLRVLAAILEEAQKLHETQLHESSVDSGMKQVCPVYPFN
jgi:hypothetical protein